MNRNYGDRSYRANPTRDWLTRCGSLGRRSVDPVRHLDYRRKSGVAKNSRLRVAFVGIPLLGLIICHCKKIESPLGHILTHVERDGNAGRFVNVPPGKCAFHYLRDVTVSAEAHGLLGEPGILVARLRVSFGRFPVLQNRVSGRHCVLQVDLSQRVAALTKL